MGLERYDIREVIAQSSRTVVRRAVRRSNGERVVLKQHAKEYPTAREIGQLEFEYRMLGKVQHATVIRAHDLVSEGERLAIVLEDFGGADLSTLAGRVPLDLFFAIAVGIARGLQAVHRAGLIHKDVTPRNVLVNPATGEVKLIDLGIATELSQERQALEAASHIEGTLPYVSPEQTGRMNRDLDHRSDYYSLGATLFELLTGAPPFSAKDAMGWVHCHISRPAPSPRDVNAAVPEAVADIVLKLLSKNPDDRYQSAHGLIADLETCRRQWVEQGVVGRFALAKHDVPERFQVSQKLFGREDEAAALRRVFSEASTGAAKWLLIGGYSGVGKSALIHELQKDIVRGHGHFVAGKFDQLDRNLPYGAVIQALRAFIKQLLGEPEETLAARRRDLCAAVGSNGRVLTALVPELEEVLGPQPPVPALAPREAHTRFQRVFADFVRSAATAEHPLVVFIDDLQWTDPSTPELLAHLLSDDSLRHLLVIGAYRDNEVHAGHVLPTTVAELRDKRPQSVREIFLGPLSETDVNRLVADTLHRDPESCRSVSSLIAQKTGGNPFFVKELLAMLARDGAFRFDAEQGRWDWDEDRIGRAAVSDNVVDLMVQRLRRLPAETTDALRLAACIGNDFDLAEVSRLAGRPPGQVAAALWEAVRERVLVPIGSAYRLVHDGRAYDDAGLDTLRVSYQFQHDRVQQAAYLLLDQADRPRVHLAIGRLLLGGAGHGQTDENVFETVNHLNLGRSLITDAAERRALAALNESAGARAKRAGAYAIAAEYFETCVDVMDPAERAADAVRVFDCGRNVAECIYFSGDPERAVLACGELSKSAPDRWCQIEVLELRAQIETSQARLMVAIATLRDGLRLVDVELPEDMESIGRLIGEGIGKMQGHLARVPVEDLVHLPEMTDREKIARAKLLFHLVVPAIQAFPPLFILAELMMFDLALTAGTSDFSCKNFVDCGIIQGGVLGDLDRAYRLGKVAFEFLKRDASRPYAAAVTFVFASFVSHWRAHYRESIQAFADAERLGLELGDNEHVAYAQAMGTQRWFFAGRPLSECQERAKRVAAYLTSVRAANELNGLRLVERAIVRLRGGEAAADGSEQAFTEQMLQTHNAQWLFLHAHAHAFAGLVLGDYEDAGRWVESAAPHTASGAIQYTFPDHFAVSTILLAKKWENALPAARPALSATLDENLARLKAWADASPGNYAVKYRLACAEVARVRGAPLDEVLANYEEAIAGDDFPAWRALGNELLAELWTSRRQPKIARMYRTQAYRLYERWGANVKVRQLRKAHPAAFEAAPAADTATIQTFSQTASSHGTSAFEGGSLDLESMIKATQAISSEVKPERLFTRLMAAIVENAGAQRGCLVFRDEATGDLHVAARASVDDAPAEAPHRGAVAIAECPDLSPDIVRYVARTRTTVVVDDAAGDEAYRDDAHIRKDAVKSVLCLPVLLQNKLVAVLYAENNAATHAFTPQRLRLLQVIASQAAISITNARLYDHLEHRVEERTRELVDKNREVAAMLNSMEQGVFTIDETLTIQPQYSRHLAAIVGTNDIAGRDSMALLFADSSVDADAVRAMRSALEFSFGVQSFMAEMNFEHLVRQFHRVAPSGDRREFEADWTLITDDQGVVGKVLVAVRDVTDLKKLTESVAQKARELDVVGQILDAGLESFKRFTASAQALVAENRSILSNAAERPDGKVLFRNMHTLKGNARMLGLSYLVETAHQAEQAHTRAQGDGRPEDADVDRAVLGASLDAVASVLDDYLTVCQRKLGQIAGATDTRESGAMTEIGAIVRAAGSGAQSAADALSRVARVVSSAEATPLAEIVRETARMLPSLARELDKASPDVECADGGLRLSPEGAEVVRDALVHAFRNALDHGIEAPGERQTRGKPPSGRIAVRVLPRKRGVSLVVSDDGRGLHLASLRAMTHDPSVDDDAVADTAFASGVSTAARVTTTSGRGVGMDAIRSFARKLGGDARILLTGETREGHRPFDLVIELPESVIERVAVAAASSSLAPARTSQRAQA